MQAHMQPGWMGMQLFRKDVGCRVTTNIYYKRESYQTGGYLVLNWEGMIPGINIGRHQQKKTATRQKKTPMENRFQRKHVSKKPLHSGLWGYDTIWSTLGPLPLFLAALAQE